MTRHGWWRAGAALVVVGLAGGCSSRDDEAGDTSADAGRADEVVTEAAGGAGAARDTGAGGDGAEPGTALDVDTVAVARREVIRTGDMDLVVDDAREAAAGIGREAERFGGFVADEHTRPDSGRVGLTVRVPAADFEELRSAVEEMGEVVEQDVTARDVTAEVVDVESRIASLEASVERLRGLLGRAGDVAQLAAVEGELASREAELEALQGQQRVLRDQVDLATLAVELSEDRPPAPDDDAAGFRDGLGRGWVVAVDAGRFTLAAAGFLLPFTVLAVPAAFLGHRWWRRRAAPTPRPGSS